MNAYELADNLITPSSVHGAFCYEAATMLRQQADRIAELEKEKEELKSSPFDGADDSTNVSKNSITQPYAYAVVQGEDSKENVSLQFDHPKMCGQKYKQAIPLYTTPQTKPLSDDDVEEFEWMLKKYFNYKPDEPAPNLNRIIRTIEARVRGEK